MESIFEILLEYEFPLKPEKPEEQQKQQKQPKPKKNKNVNEVIEEIRPLISWDKELKVEAFKISPVTLAEKVVQISELVTLDDVNSKELIEIFNETTFTPEDLSIWGGYGGGNLFSKKKTWSVD